MSVKMRQKVEREICTAVVDALLAAGFSIEVDNGDDMTTQSDVRPTILEAMFKTDDERLYVERAGADKCVGWVYFVYGNDGWDVISDYTVNLEPYIGAGSRVQKIVDEYAD